MKLDRRRGRWIALGLFIFTALPVLAAFGIYLFGNPDKRMNYGELVTPTPVPQVKLQTSEGSEFRFSDLKGKWLLVRIGKASCDDACAKQLFFMRQVRLMQGRETERLVRVWLVTDTSALDPHLVEAYKGTIIVRGNPAEFPSLNSPGSGTAAIYVVDPLGQVMLRFPADPDPIKASKDIARLLKVSHVG
jgi:hypothetical protein